ncbi:LPS export ABC transporter periplasmic protein LptC [Aquabacter spiritensis]|uniref:Lipopolysaccharide export system protein LptC n=1 Tax=Aquabacter spiritensis TaxID=933073 RepID=A0A4R3M0V2_9HYPH|nr:LPS export ABC transporter periplasmic protein LptC [Aquabacter spiritensis]TCT04737.1 lipopolysaccharide export system protein LptC [Aquabacter spiritensis]
MNDSASPVLDGRRDTASFGAHQTADYGRAYRHSRAVRFAKRALPVALAGALGILILGAVVKQLGATVELPFEIGTLHLSGTRLTMEVPKLSGFTDDGRGYRVNAATASQDMTNPDVLELTNIDARMELADKGWASVASAAGTVDTKRQFIHLTGGVRLATHSGYAGEMQDADVDVKAGALSTTNPVRLTYRSGTLVADRMTVTDRGSRALFEGHVQLDFSMTDIPAPSGTPAPAAPADGAKR